MKSGVTPGVRFAAMVSSMNTAWLWSGMTKGGVAFVVWSTAFFFFLLFATELTVDWMTKGVVTPVEGFGCFAEH